MNVSNEHNLARDAAASREGRFGIRVSAPADDPFLNLVEEGWNRTHWFTTRADRDATLADMQRRHEYSRDSDKPSLVFEAIERADDQGS